MSNSYVKLFNKLMDDFFNEMIEMYPNETRIKVNYSLYQTVCKASYKKPINDFMVDVVPYLEQIAVRDDIIFTGDNQPPFLKKMKFERLWNSDSMSPGTKIAIWKYIQKFIELGSNVVEMPFETHELIKYIITS